MKGRDRKDSTVTTPDATGTPFFARFLEGQYGESKPAVECMTLKYPSDRDEIDNYLPDYVEAAPSNAGPSRMTLKYPSDRDEIEPYLAPYGNSAGAP